MVLCSVQVTLNTKIRSQLDSMHHYCHHQSFFKISSKCFNVKYKKKKVMRDLHMII